MIEAIPRYEGYQWLGISPGKGPPQVLGKQHVGDNALLHRCKTKGEQGHGFLIESAAAGLDTRQPGFFHQLHA
jgi:hypothetical protein